MSGAPQRWRDQRATAAVVKHPFPRFADFGPFDARKKCPTSRRLRPISAIISPMMISSPSLLFKPTCVAVRYPTYRREHPRDATLAREKEAWTSVHPFVNSRCRHDAPSLLPMSEVCLCLGFSDACRSSVRRPPSRGRHPRTLTRADIRSGPAAGRKLTALKKIFNLDAVFDSRFAREGCAAPSLRPTGYCRSYKSV